MNVPATICPTELECKCVGLLRKVSNWSQTIRIGLSSEKVSEVCCARLSLMSTFCGDGNVLSVVQHSRQ